MLPNSLQVMNVNFLVNQLPGYFLWKNLDSVYIGSSANTAKLLGFKHMDDLVEKQDYDIPCDAAEYAAHFVNEDKKVIKENSPIKMLARYPFVNGELKTLFINKSLLKGEDGKPIAVQGHMIEVNNKILSDFIAQLAGEDSKKFMPRASSKKPLSYRLDGSYRNLSLSNRESECLFYVIRGKSARSIGEILHLSPRTVEFHIEQIKNKMGVDRKEDVIEKALEMGFMEVIPDGILSAQLSGLVCGVAPAIPDSLAF